MKYRTLRNGQKISTIGIGVGNYGYENVPLDEIAKIFRTAFDKGVIDYAFELKRTGIIRNVAFSSHTPSVALKTLEKYDFDAMFFGINAGYDYEPCESGLQISQERVKLYELCRDRGTAITVMKVYNNGQLLDKRFSPFGRAMTHAQCMQYALDRPAVVPCLAGAITAEEMAKTLAFYDTTPAEMQQYLCDFHFPLIFSLVKKL